MSYKTDFSRWANADNSWNSRTALIGAMVPPGSKVLEFGAGAMALRKYLPEGCKYIPSDVIEREPGMLVCDLNAPRLGNLPRADVVVFGGVLEYVEDVPRVIHRLRRLCRTIIASYAVGSGEIVKIRGDGWVNNYSLDQFIAIFQRNGFALAERRDWNGQIVFRFQR